MILTVFSAAALLCAAVLITGTDFSVLYTLACESRRRFCAVLFLLPVFLFIPVGALPAFADIACSAIVAFVLAVFSIVIYERKVTLSSLSVVAAALCLCVLMTMARDYGFPGTVYSLDILSSVCVWLYLPLYGICCALFSLFLLLFAAFELAKKNKHDVFVRLAVLFFCAAAVSFAVPFNLLFVRFLSGFSMYAAGFVCFWTASVSLSRAILAASARRQ